MVDSSNSAISFISSFRTRRTVSVVKPLDASRRTTSGRLDASRRTKSFFSSSDKIALKSIIRGLAPLCVPSLVACVDFILFYA